MAERYRKIPFLDTYMLNSENLSLTLLKKPPLPGREGMKGRGN